MSEFNPADHKVDEVEAYVAENPQEAKAVLAAEKARGDDARKTLVSSLKATVDSQPDVPVAAEAPAVQVSTSPTPTGNTLLGKEYEVSPERGYRVKS